jgi:hypothetical protein
MSDVSRAPRETAGSDGGPDWPQRLIVAAVIVIVIVVGCFLAAAFVPRWWAQRVGDQVDGSMSSGILLGLFYGFLFTLVPLAVVALATRWRRSWRAWAIAGAIALLLASPNLMTLGIVVGAGSGSHAGDRILDVEAPGFRGATLAGAIVAAVLVGAVGYLLVSRRRARRAEAAARGELAEARARAETPSEAGENADRGGEPL